VIRFDHLYIGGGNAADLTFPLAADVTIVPNTDGLTGGIRLWREHPATAADTSGEGAPAGSSGQISGASA
jgi:polyphosphate glucokinase